MIDELTSMVQKDAAFRQACVLMLAALHHNPPLYRHIGKQSVLVSGFGSDDLMVAVTSKERATVAYRVVDEQGNRGMETQSLQIRFSGGLIVFIARHSEDELAVSLTGAEFVALMQHTLIPHFAKLTLNGDVKMQAYNPEENDPQ